MAVQSKGSSSLRHRRGEWALHSLLPHHPLPMFVYDPDTFAILFSNKAAVDRYGYSRTQFLRMKLTDLLSKSDAGRFRQEARRAKSQPSFVRRWQHRLQSGEVLEVETITCSLSFQHRDALLMIVNDAPEKARLHDELKQRESQLRATLYSIGDAVIATDRKGIVTMMNPVAEKLTGWNEREALGRKLEQIFQIKNEATGKKAANPVKRVLREGVVVGLANHTVLVARDGVERPIADAGAPIFDARGKTSGVVLVFRDQTAERLAQRAVQEAREFAESIIATVREPLLVLDENLEVVSANRSFFRVFQTTPEETVGCKVYELGNGQWNIPKLRTLLEDILPSNSHFDDFEVTHEFERIGTRTMLLNAQRLYREQHHTQLILLAIEDVTERARTLHALQESEERFRYITGVISDYAYSFRVNPDKSLVGQWVSGSFTKIFGYTLAEIQARGGWQRMVHPADLPALQRHALRVASGSDDVCEVRFVTRSGEVRWLRDYATPVWDEREQRVVRIYGAAQDITEKKKAEEQLQQIFQYTTNLFYSHTPDHVLTYVSPQSRNFLGCEPDEAMVRWTEFTTDHPANRRGFELTERAIHTGKAQPPYELQLRKKSGELIWVEVREAPVVQDGKVTAIVGSLSDITERKRAEEALQESEARYRTLFESVPIGVGVADRHGNILAVNEALLRQGGFTPDERERVQHVRQFYPDDSVRENVLALLRRDGYVRNYPLQFRRKDGSLYDARMSLRMVEHRGEQWTIAIVEDVTELKKAEEALRQSEERYRHLVNTAPDVIYSLSQPEGIITSLNPAFEKLTGWKREEWIGKSFVPLIHPDDLPVALATTEQVRQGLAPDPYELRVLTTSGEYRVGEFTSTPQVENGVVVGELGIVRDITVRKRALEALKRSEQQYRLLFEGVNDAIMIFEPEEEIILEVNRKACELYGFSRDEFIGRSLKSLSHDVKQGEERIRQILKDRSLLNFETIHFRKDGQPLYLLINGSVVEYNGRPAILSVNRDITHWRAAERALRESEERYRSLFEQAPVAIYLADPSTHRVVFANNAFLNLLGYTRKEVERVTFYDFVVHPRESVDENYRRVMEEGSRSLGPRKWRRQDGSLVDVDVLIMRVQYGGKAFFCGIGTDITERVLAEKALRENEQRYRSIVENITQAYYETDARGLFTYCNPGLILASGYTEQELAGLLSYRLVAPEHRRKVMETYRQRLDEKRTDWSMEFMVETKHGRKLWVEQITHFEYDTQGNLLKTTNILRDIDERKKAEEELERHRALLSSIFEASRDGIILEDENGIIHYANSSFARIYGYESPHELIGQHISRVQSPQDNERMLEYSRKRLRGEPVPALYEFQGVRKDGSSIDLEVSVAVIENGPQRQILSVVRDITERKNAERERELLKQQLIQSQKLEGIGTLASGIAHDFNNVLGIIMGHASLLEKVRDNPQRLSSSVETILQATERGAALVRQILTFARKAETVPQPLDLSVLLKEMGKMLRETFPKMIEIHVDLEKHLPPIIADPTQVHQVVLNLSVNARDAMPHGGTLTISSRRVNGDELARRFPTANAPEYVELAVTDTGVGIEPKVYERMFEPFFTTKPPGHGTGLGLSVVHGIVTSHHGFIDCDTAVGKGTTFRAYFPVPEQPVDLRNGLRDPIAVRGGTETILLVEDEEFLREMVMGLLTAEGYRVVLARDGDEGVQKFAELRDQIHLVVSDLGLPKLSGAQVARRIREMNPKARIVIVSGYYDPEVRSELQELGVDYLMAKPYRGAEVLKVVRDVLDKPV